MANNKENLVSLADRTTEEQRAIAKKGGIASGEVRKEKASFKKAIQWLVNSDIKLKEGSISEAFEKSGIDISNLNPTQLATIGLWMGAVQGNSTNYRTLMEANEELQDAAINIKDPVLNVVINSDDKIKETFFDKGDIE